MTVPFLIDFKPYEFVGEQCQSIDDMISISLLQQLPVSFISYDIASSDDINLPIAIKNITNNTNIEVTITIDANIFIIDNQSNVSNKTIQLGAGETGEFVISLNVDSLNNTIKIADSNINIVVKSITNGGIVTRNVPVMRLNTKVLEERLLF